jgi:hypothetical protein
MINDFATLGSSWNFSLSEILAIFSLQDGLRSGIIITKTSRPASQPASWPPTYINWYISATNSQTLPKFET